MRLAGVFAAAAICAVTVACNQDPAKSVRIAAAPVTNTFPPISPARVVEASPPAREAKAMRPPQPEVVASAPVTTQAAEPNPVAGFCPPPAEDSAGPGGLALTGPCVFQHQAEVKCESSPDDFIIGFVRKAMNDATVAVYVNVENYHGPGTYDGTQMFVAVQSGTAIYRWSNDNVHATVGPDEAFLELPMARLDAEPMLVNCSRLIGPASNYQYQCGSRATGSATAATTEIVTGRLICNRTK